MVSRLQKFFKSTPLVVDVALSIVLVSVGVGIGALIFKSHRVTVTGEGVEIVRELIETRSQRDRAVTVIKIYEKGVGQIEEEAANFTRRYPAGKVILDEVEDFQEIVESAEPEELERITDESDRGQKTE